MPEPAGDAVPLAYFNGQFLPSAELRLPVFDAGFVLGATVTDFCRTFRRQLFRLEDHLARFRRGCEAAGVPQPLSDEELARVAERLTAHNAALLKPGQELALVLFGTPGPLPAYAGWEEVEPRPTLGMHTFPLGFSRMARFFREGVRLVVPPTRHVPAECLDPSIKQRSRLHWWVAEQQARQLDADAVALLLNREGYVTETAAANFLMARDGTVLTPPAGTVLDGVSLRVVRELCQELGIPFVERSLSLEECPSADEAMLSNTSYCLAPVSSLNGKAIPWPGPIFRALLRRWGEVVGVDIAGQITAG